MNLANPKLGGGGSKTYLSCFLPGGHGGSRILSFAPYVKQRDSNFTCPVILFRITGWGTFPGADGRPVAERVVRRVSGSHKPRPSKLKKLSTSLIARPTSFVLLILCHRIRDE